MLPDPWDPTSISFPTDDMQDNPLNLHDSMDTNMPRPNFTQKSTEWISRAERILFAQGNPATDPQAEEAALAALSLPDQLSSPFGLDASQPKVRFGDVRAQPTSQDHGYHTDTGSGKLPNMTAIIYALLLQHEVISRNQMIYLIVDNCSPSEVPHWPAFSTWWALRRCLVRPQEEATDVLWFCADETTGLGSVPYHWAGVFVLEAARFLYAKQHFALVDNDCAPVTFFEVSDFVELAHRQQWIDLVGHPRRESGPHHGIGMFLFTEAHLEYNAGLVISLGSNERRSPIQQGSTAVKLAQELHRYRQQLLSMTQPPSTPTESAVSGTMFTPFVVSCGQSQRGQNRPSRCTYT